MKFRKTRLVRTLCRLFGEEKGQAMMEYVVLGVLIVAAAVFAVVKFGDEIVRLFGIMTKAPASPDEVPALVDDNREKTETDVNAAKDFANQVHGSDGGGENVGDGSSE